MILIRYFDDYRKINIEDIADITAKSLDEAKKIADTIAK